MDSFWPYFSQIIHAMLAVEAPLSIGLLCNCNRPGAQRLCHCQDCSFFEPCCEQCFIETHRQMPFHWVEYWMETYFERRDISQIGHIITFGHDAKGGSCPHSDVNPIDFILTDINGVHKTKINFCACIGRKKD